MWKKISSSCKKYATIALEEKRSLSFPFIRIKILRSSTGFKCSSVTMVTVVRGTKTMPAFFPFMNIFQRFLQHNCPEFMKLLCTMLHVQAVSTHEPFCKLLICAQLVLFKLRIEIISGFRDEHNRSDRALVF